MDAPTHAGGHPDLAEPIAVLAHEAWCRKMIDDGWTPGAEFSDADRIHDAIVPFERLSPDDRQATAEAMRFDDAEQWLARLVEYPHDPERPFTAAEVRVGLVVVELKKEELDASPTRGLDGKVVNWTTYPSRALKMINVKSSDGEETEHSPYAAEIRRA